MKSWPHIILVLSCAINLELNAQKTRSFYKFHDDFKEKIENRNFSHGLESLELNDHFRNSRHRLVYFMEMGSMHHYEANYSESNYWLNKADIYMEDFRKKKGEMILSTISNPYAASYRGEDFEALYINYYKALNYLALNMREEALVEVRRMEILLNEMNDLYPDNKFNKDAFIHLVMGLIYDASEDYNNAFIAYRNAYKIYEQEYLTEYGVQCPEQLIKDMIRTASWSGLEEEYEYYSRRLLGNASVDMEKKPSAIIIWHNGRAPRKVEESIQFTVANVNGFVTFQDASNNEEYKFAEGALKTMAFFNALNGNSISSYKMSFSKYEIEKPKYLEAEVCLPESGKVQKLELCEDVSGIAIRSHKDRKSRELSQALLRMAVRQSLKSTGKYAIEKGLESASDYAWLGDLAGVIFELAFDGVSNKMEKADLRQWYSLPHSIYYTRIELKESENELYFDLEGIETKSMLFTIDTKGHEVVFKVLRTH